MENHSVKLLEALADCDQDEIDKLYDEKHRVDVVEFAEFMDRFSDKDGTKNLFLAGVEYLVATYGDRAFTVPLRNFERKMAVSIFNFATSFDARTLLKMILECSNMLLFIDEKIPDIQGGWTPLFSACVNYNVECALMLIAAGCDWSIKNCVGTRPLLYISFYDGMTEVVKALVDDGADPRDRLRNKYSGVSDSIIHDAIGNLKVFLESGKVNGNTLLGDKGTNDATILMLASAHGNVGATSLCVQYGGSPLQSDGFRNAIEYAIGFERWACATLLLCYCQRENLIEDAGRYIIALFSKGVVFYGLPMENLDQFQSFCLPFMCIDTFKQLLHCSSGKVRFTGSIVRPEALLEEKRNITKCSATERGWTKYFYGNAYD